jgi:hypothetical protein
MTVTVLVAAFRGTRIITIHEGEIAAETALMVFVDRHWVEQFGGDLDEISLSGNERLQRFFADNRNSYIIAEANLSQLEAYIDSARSDTRE